MRHRICSVFVTGALALGSLFAIAPMAVAAEASVSHCVAPADLIRLDQPLRRTARRLASHKLIMIVALGSSSTAGAGASSAETTYPSSAHGRAYAAVPNSADHGPKPRHQRRTCRRHARPLRQECLRRASRPGALAGRHPPNLRSFHPIRSAARIAVAGPALELGGALCSASSASRSQVRAMSIRMVRTRKFGACSAICRHSAACSLHSTDVIIAMPRTKTRAILTRTRCFVRSISRDASHFGAHSGVRATKFRLFQPG